MIKEEWDTMLRHTDDIRVDSLRPLLPPAILTEEIPLTEEAAEVVLAGRAALEQILNLEDDRLCVVVGPCSIHDPAAGLEYAQLLQQAREQYGKNLHIIMRVYFEKPRTTVGWKGLINDPTLDGRFHINEGLRIARRLLYEIVCLGVPAGCEFLDPITPQFIADLVSWGAIGARTTESQVHRELASGLSMPVGFKNGTGGSIQIAIDAIRSSAHPHRFLGVTKQSVAAIVSTRGNPHSHIILRGGKEGPNYDAAAVQVVAQTLIDAGLTPRIMVDCSHANSQKDHLQQPLVSRSVAEQIAGGDRSIFGVMLESFLKEGRQSLDTDEPLTYGLSVTDACMNWEQTDTVLSELADAVQTRRNQAQPGEEDPSVEKKLA